MKKNLNKLHPNTCRTLPGAAEHGTAVYAVIGDPIEHSRSPEIYAPMFEQFGINAVFLKIRMISPFGLLCIQQAVSRLLHTQIFGFAYNSGLTVIKISPDCYGIILIFIRL